MNSRIMLLPSKEPSDIRLISIPDDLKEQEAYRHATGIIAAIEESQSDWQWSDIEDALEEHGFQLVEYIMGPALD